MHSASAQFKRSAWALLLLAIGLICGGLALLPRQPATPQQLVGNAWQRAQTSGSYRYIASIEQTTTQPPSLAAAGGARQQTSHVTLDGTINQRAQQLHLTLWPNGSGRPEEALELVVDQQQARGRQGSGPWQEIDNPTDLFAPGGDPLGFLAGMDHVAFAGDDTRSAGGTTFTFQRYTFDLDGSAFGAAMQAKLEVQLRQRGQLPIDMQLGLSDQYRQLNGTGELWLDSDGLPARLVLHVTLPPQPNGRLISASITSDFMDFDQQRLALASTSLWQSPLGWARYRLSVAVPALRTFGQGTLVWLLEIIALIVAVRLWQRRRVQALVAGSLIMILLTTPLLHAQNVAAFSQAQQDQQAAQTAQQQQHDQQQQALASVRSTWNPHQDPQRAPATTTAPALPGTLVPTAADTLAATTSAGTDSDGDGLSDVDEDEWNTCPSASSNSQYCDGVADPRDSDGDGLLDGTEVNQLGTIPSVADSDNDSIDDGLEVQGFSRGGTMWYLDPLTSDTNHDHQPDGAECPPWSNANPDRDPAAACPDSDGDGTPDVFDNDNDADGVEDAVDLSPTFYSSTVYNASNPLSLTITNLQTDYPVFVDIQLRPTNPEHLTYQSRVLDWPANDSAGQIQRVLTTTFATSTNSAIRSAAINADYGDVQVVPMLEITIPYTSGHYANLPVTPTYQGVARTQGITVSQWLDTTELDPYGITVRDVDATSGDLVAYVPVTMAANAEGGNIGAFTARMLYYPGQGSNGVADWGSAQQVRLLWLVQMITDECIDQAADPATCERVESMSVVQTYDEDWMLAGLAVSEDHGATAAVLYEDPAQDDDLALDDQLWMVAWNMTKTFMRARDCDVLSGSTCTSDGVRDVRVDNLASAISSWSGGSSDVQVANFSYQHEGYLADIAMTQITALLEQHFTPYAAQTTPTFLVAQEKTNRSANLEERASLGSSISIDLDPAQVKLTTVVGMSWSPYQYVSGTWTNANLEDYLTLLESTLRGNDDFLADVLGDDAAINGKLIWAQLFYTVLSQGMLGLAEIDGSPVWAASSDALSETDYATTWFTNNGMAQTAQEYEVYINQVYNNLRKASSTLNLWAKFNRVFSTTTFSPEIARQFKLLTATTNYVIGASIGLTLIGAGLIFAGYASGNTTLIKVGAIMLTAGRILVTTMRTVIVVSQMVLMVRSTTGLVKTLTALESVCKANRSLGLVGIVLALSTIWGAFFFQLGTGQFAVGSNAFNLALANTVAQTIGFFVILIISLIPVIGALIVVLISLIDLILSFFDIQGFSGWLTEFIAGQLYDVDTVIANLSDPDRLEIAISSINLGNSSSGYVSDNTLNFSLSVTNTLRYTNQASNSEARRSTFRYFLQPSPTDQHANLHQDAMHDEWTSLDGRQLRYSTELALAEPVALSTIGSGVNQTLDGHLYLTEAFVAPYEGCWLAFGIEADCTWYENKGSSHTNLGQYQVFDILPPTISDFVAMGWNHNYQVAMPTQRDLDGDGLLAASLGGADPNDNTYDSDGDGLSDAYELSHGTDPRSADSDGDRLTDAEELTYRSNPRSADSDGDGLSDYIEVKQGWLVDYTAADGSTKLTRTWSDPRSSDADDDSLSDLEEYTFGFNPWIATDPSLIDNRIRIDDPVVSERDTPLLLARFEEAGSAERFSDSSGNGHTLACASCPVSGVDGRYGSGLSFDSSTYITSTSGVLELAKGSFTLAAWIKTTSVSQGIITKSDDDGAWERGEKSFYINASGYPTFVGWGNRYIRSTSPVTDGLWHHVAVTWDYPPASGSTGGVSGTARLYIDGADRTSASTNYVANNADNAGDTLAIGRSNSNPNEAGSHFSGALDEAVAYDRALTASEITRLMDGRYNPNDLLLAPGADLTYQATITNTLPAQAANGHLTASSQTIDPSSGSPALALRFEDLDRKHTFANRSGARSSATCVGSTCPSSEFISGTNLALHFDGSDDAVELPLQMGRNLAFPRELGFKIKVESLPAAGQIASIYASNSDANGALNIYLNSSGNLVFAIKGSVSDTYYNGSTYFPGWTEPHISVYSFATHLNTWVDVRWKISAPFTRLYINGSTTEESYLIYSTLAEVELGNGRFGATHAGTPSFHGSLDTVTIKDRYNIKVLDLGFNEDYTYDGSSYYNSAGSSSTVPCTDGAPSTCPAYNLTGVSGQSISFDGVDDYVPLSTSRVFDGSGTGVVSFWLNVAALPSSGSQASIIDTDCGVGEDCLDLYLNDSGHLVIKPSSWTPMVSNFTFNSSNLNTWVKVKLEISVGWSSGYDTTILLYFNEFYDNYFTKGTSANGLRVAAGRLGNSMDGSAPYHGGMDAFTISQAYNLSFDAPPFDFEEINQVNNARAATCAFYITCPAFSSSGRYGGALVFDGVDDYLSVDPLTFAVGDYTIGMWFKSAGSTQQAMFSATDPTNSDRHGVYLELQPDGRLRWLHRFPTGSSGGSNIYTSASYNDDAWHYLTAVKADANLALYVDGAVVGTQTTATTSTLPLDITLGRLSPSSASRYFSGALDEITVIPSAVDQRGVAYLMQSTYPALDIPADFIEFSLAPQTAGIITGSASVNTDISSSQQRIDQEAEAAIALQSEIDYPVTDANTANLPLFLPFEDVPGSSVFHNVGDLSAWSFYSTTLRTATCTPPDCPTAGLRGQIDRAIYFDGQGDSLDFGTCCEMVAQSVAAWINGDSGTIIDTRRSNKLTGLQLDFDRFSVVVDSDGSSGTGGEVEYTLPLDIPENTWTHVVGTVDFNTYVASVYINGTLASTMTLTALGNLHASLTSVWPTIGRNPGEGNDFYHGYLDDLRLYSKTLSASEVQTLYRESAAQLQLQFDEDADATFFRDSSPNAATGIPSTTQCGALTLDVLTATSLASSPSTFAVSSGTDRLGRAEVAEVNVAVPITGSAVLCAGDSLTLAQVSSDGSTSVIGSQTVDVTASGSASASFQSGGDALTLTWSIGATPLYQYNPAPGTDGKIGHTALFDGHGAIRFDNASAVNSLTNRFTIIGWIKPDKPTSATTVQRIIAAGRDQSVNGYGFGLLGSNLRFSTLGIKHYDSAASITPDVWQQVAVVFDSSNDASFYLDGQLVDSIAGTSPATINLDDPLYVGSSTGPNGPLNELFHGQIDELSVYKRELNAAEIYSMYLRDLRWYRARSTTYMTVDTDAPSVRLLSAYPYRANAPFQLAVAATDPTSRVTLVDIGVQGPDDSAPVWQGAPVCAEAANSGTAWCPSIDPADHGGAGAYSVQLRAVDAVGNQTLSDFYTLYVDGDAPTAVLTSAESWRQLTPVAGSELSWTVALSGTISDPDLPGAIAGSGVLSNAVQISLFDERGQLAGTGSAQTASVSGDSWSIDYMFVGVRPSGHYTVQISAQDAVGNTLAQTLSRPSQLHAAAIILDARPPSVDVDSRQWSGLLISETAQLSGTISELPAWAGTLARYHFEDSGATLYDSSGQGLSATCVNCPTPSSGLFASARSFAASAGTQLTVAPTTALDLSVGTLSAWIKPDWASGSNGFNPSILALSDGSATRYGWRISDDYGALWLDNGTSALSIPVALTPNTWQHVALVEDGSRWTAYLNGVAVGSVAQSFGTATDLPLSIGSGFSGDLDEVTLFDRALSADEVYALAQADVSGVQTLEQWLEPHHFDGSSAAEDWQPLSLDQAGSLATWATTPPTATEGFYVQHLRGSDTFGNSGSQQTVWRGAIDTLAPRVTLSIAFSGGGSTAQTHYSVVADDLFIDPDALSMPCANPSVAAGYASDPARINQLSASCTVSSHVETPWSATACDYAGHCTSVTQTPPAATDKSSVLITAPATGSVLTVTDELAIRGAAFATAGIDEVQVTVNGVLLATLSYTNSLTDTLWSTPWLPETTGSYTITAQLYDQQQQVYTDTIQLDIVAIDLAQAQRVYLPLVLRP